MRPSAAAALRSLRFDELPLTLRIAVYFYIVRLPLQGKPAALELGAFFILLFLGVAVARREVRPLFHILVFPLFLYCLASTLSALVNNATIHAFADAMTWFKMLIFPALLTIYAAVPRLREVIIRGDALFAVLIAVWGLFEYVVLGQRTLETRITGPSTHVMTYSGQLLPLSLFFAVLAAHRQRWWLWGTAVLSSLALLLTFTRSVWFGWMAGLLVLLVLKRPRWLVYVIPMLLIVVSLLPMNFFGRLVSSFDVRQASNLDRIRMAEAGIEIIKDYPTLGVGPANVKEIYPLYRKPDAPRFRPSHLHNNVIQIWAERGILGLAAYVSFLILFLRECARGWHGPRREFAQAGVAMAVALTYAGLFEFNWGDTEVLYTTLQLFALVVASLRVPAEVVSNESAASLVPATT
jgi:O-antigen ligase